MAWQLIYTSAPRLLEAGRSGFGTVARHRAIPNLLVGAIERISQFSRLPGLAEHRIIYSHRHINVSGTRYHVISRISDAGADYTGRTNHIAHHLVIEPREIANALVTPADVLLSYAWKTGWDEAPRYFDAAEEVSLGSIQQRVRLPAQRWEAASGKKRYAALLLGSDVLRGCCLAYTHNPNSDDLQQFAVHLFGESLLLTGGRMWSFPFTTNLQPSDDAVDFLWSGVWVNSPVRTQIEQSERTIFFLEMGGVVRNGSSSQVPVPTGAAADLAETGRPAVTEHLPTAPAISSARSESAVPDQPFVPRISEPKKTTTIGVVASRKKSDTQHFATPPPARKWNVLIPVLVVTGVVVVLLSAFGYSKIGQWWQTYQEHKNAVIECLKDVPGHQYSDVSTLMNQYDKGQIDTIKDLATNWQSALATTAGPKCNAIDGDCRDLQNLEKPESVHALVTRVRGWLDLRAKVVDGSVTTEKYDEYAKLISEINNQDKNLSLSKIREALIQCNAIKRCEFLLSLLKVEMKPAYPVAWFREKLDLINKDIPKNPEDRDLELPGKMEQIEKTIALWEGYNATEKAGKPTDDLQKNPLITSGNAPVWLASAIKKSTPPQPAAVSTLTGEQGEKALSMGDEKTAQQTSPTAEFEIKNGTKSIYVVVGDDGLSQLDTKFDTLALKKLTLLKDDKKSLLDIFQDKYFKAEKMWFQSSQGGKIEHVVSLFGGQEKQPVAPYMLEGEKPGLNTQFQIRVLATDPRQNPKPLKFEGGLVIVGPENKHQIRLDDNFKKLAINLILPPDAKLKLPLGFDPFAQKNSPELLSFQNFAADVISVDDIFARKRSLENKVKPVTAAVDAQNPFEGFATMDPKAPISVKSKAIYDHLCALPLTELKDAVANSGVVKGLLTINDPNALYAKLVDINRFLEIPPLPKRAVTPQYTADKLIFENEHKKWAVELPKCENGIKAMTSKQADADQQKKDQTELENLKKNPLLSGKLTSGTYSVVAGDNRSESTIIEFIIP